MTPQEQTQIVITSSSIARLLVPEGTFERSDYDWVPGDLPANFRCSIALRASPERASA